MLATIHTAKEAYPVDVPTDFLYDDWNYGNGSEELSITHRWDTLHDCDDTDWQEGEYPGIIRLADYVRRRISSRPVEPIQLQTLTYLDRTSGQQRAITFSRPSELATAFGEIDFSYGTSGLPQHRFHPLLDKVRATAEVIQGAVQEKRNDVSMQRSATSQRLHQWTEALRRWTQQKADAAKTYITTLHEDLAAEPVGLPYAALPPSYQELLLKHRHGRFLDKQGLLHLKNGADIAAAAFDFTRSSQPKFSLLQRQPNPIDALNRYAAQVTYAESVYNDTSTADSSPTPRTRDYSINRRPNGYTSNYQIYPMRDEAASWPLYQERRHHAPDAFPSLMYARTAAPVAMRKNATSRPIAKATEHETSRGIAVIPDPKDPTAFVLSSADTPEVDCKVELIGNAVRVILVENGREKLNTQEMYAPYLLSQIDEGNREQADKAMYGIQRALGKYLANITDNTLSKYSAEQIVAILSECTEKIAHQTSFTMA